MSERTKFLRKRDIRRPCQPKVRYKLEAHALRVASLRLRSGVPYLRVYLCPWCKGFHLTSQEGT